MCIVSLMNIYFFFSFFTIFLFHKKNFLSMLQGGGGSDAVLNCFITIITLSHLLKLSHLLDFL